MATYNGSQFIDKQLDSIRQQTLAPDYVLMRDDCSTDNTIEVVEKYIETYQLSGWSIQKNDKNLGWRLNFRQLMLDAVPYDVDYVFFSDQDDIWYLDKNERQVTVMEERNDIDLLSADIDIEVRSQNATVPDQFKFDDSEPISKYPDVLTYRTYRPGWTLCSRKSFLDIIIKHWTADDNISHDNLFSNVALALGRAANLNQSVGIHMRYENNASGNRKYRFTIKSSKEQHIEGLYVFSQFYMIIMQVVREVTPCNISKISDICRFYEERYVIAKSNNTMANVKYTLTNINKYENLSAVARDIIFAFKK